MNKKRVLMAMSGGVDSSVSALMLQNKGFMIYGATFITCDANLNDPSILGAQKVAERMGFEHQYLDIRELFKSTVIADFIEQYLAGHTPNPCAMCNPIIKWGELLRLADEKECHFLATGHYARIGQTDDGRYFLRRGVDGTKDQTYFLWRLSQEQLSRTIFPLGEFIKPQVKEFAAQNGFVELSQKKESQEICFVKDDNYRNFLEQNVPQFHQIVKNGDFIDLSGKKLGTHNGYVNYTIGQRKGLGIALGEPAYVVKIDSEKNEVVIGKKDDLLATKCYAHSTQWSKIADFNDGDDALAKVRYRTKAVPCRLFHEQNQTRVEFADPVESITPGQSIVFYDINASEDQIGGGIIKG